MYCTKCGKQNAEEAKYCKSCGKELKERITDVEADANETVKFWIKIGIILIVLLIILFQVFENADGISEGSSNGGSYDLKRLVGTWQLIDLQANEVEGEFIIEFYEPNVKNGTIGNLRYVTYEGIRRRGEYNYHESSKTLELALFDEFNCENQWTEYFTFTLDFESDDCIMLESEKYLFELNKIEE